MCVCWHFFHYFTSVIDSVASCPIIAILWRDSLCCIFTDIYIYLQRVDILKQREAIRSTCHNLPSTGESVWGLGQAIHTGLKVFPHKDCPMTKRPPLHAQLCPYVSKKLTRPRNIVR